MTRGKGVRLQKYKDGGVADARVFAKADGLTWQDSSGRTFIRALSELKEWVGERAQAGRIRPDGFPRYQPVRHADRRVNAMLANAETKWGVLKTFNALVDAIANGRLNETMACFSDDADVALFGSDLSDTSLGAVAIRQHMAAVFARPYRIVFHLTPGKISALGHVAWLTADGTYRLSTDEVNRPYRLSAVFERRRDQWLVQLFSGSEPRV